MPRVARPDEVLALPGGVLDLDSIRNVERNWAVLGVSPASKVGQGVDLRGLCDGVRAREEVGRIVSRGGTSTSRGLSTRVFYKATVLLFRMGYGGREFSL